MWYEILVEKEFVEYFSNEDNVFYTVEGEEKILAPMFRRFADVVCGVTYAWTLPEISLCQAKEILESQADILRGFEYCRLHMAGTTAKSLGEIMRSIPEQPNQSRYVDVEKLNGEQCAVSLMYPFWQRMGSSFELDFQQSGELKNHLLALQNKCFKGDPT